MTLTLAFKVMLECIWRLCRRYWDWTEIIMLENFSYDNYTQQRPLQMLQYFQTFAPQNIKNISFSGVVPRKTFDQSVINYNKLNFQPIWLYHLPIGFVTVPFPALRWIKWYWINISFNTFLWNMRTKFADGKYLI